jgi:4-amino-4-deoxy-L-arabinose transferase-like glycosyltransferase
MNRKKWAKVGSIALLIAISTWLFTLSNTYRDSISGDFPEYIGIAKNLSLNPETFDPTGTWPLGYPLLLRLASGTGSWQHAGSLISFIFSATIGISAFYLLRTCYDKISSLLGAIASIMTRPALVCSVGYSSDVPAMAFAFLSLTNFTFWAQKKSLSYLFMAGFCAGLSYLIRYSSVTVALSLLAMIPLCPLFERKPFNIKTIFKQLFIFLGGWILAASPQLSAHGSHTEIHSTLKMAAMLHYRWAGI